jgi:hypothetical protein
MGAFFGEISGANRRAAESAGNAAKAQQREARRQQELAISAADSPQQLATLERQLQTQERGLARQEKLAAAIDPVTLEASQQALGLLRGEEAQALAPLRKQRQRQRQELINSLREQMGPGAESSSAGLQALRKFDTQTSETLAGAQSGALGQLFGLASSGQDQRFSQVAQGFGSAAQGFGSIAQRKVGAITGTAAGVTGSAGAQFVRSSLRAGQQQQIGSDIFKTATIGAMGGFGGGGLFGGGGALSPDIVNNFGTAAKQGGKLGLSFDLANPFGKKEP